MTPIEDHAASDENTLFASAAWFDRWLRAFGGPRSGYWSPPGEPDAPNIPYVLHTRRIGPCGLLVASSAANSHTPMFDVCGSGQLEAHHLLAMIKALDVCALTFSYLSSTSRILQALINADRRLWWFQEACEDTAIVECLGGWDSYLAGRKKDHLSNWKKRERRVLQAGGTFEVHDSWAEISRHFCEILEVEASGWKGRKGTSIIQDEEVRLFYEGLFRDLTQLGKARLFILRLDGRIIAFQLSVLHEGRLSHLKTGYLEELASLSAGQVIKYWVLKWAFAQADIKIIDFLGPVSANKLRWATRVVPLYTAHVFRRSPGGALMWLRHIAAPRIMQRLRGIFSIGNSDRRNDDVPDRPSEPSSIPSKGATP